MKLDATGTDVTNTAFYTIRTGDTSGDLVLEVLNYITSDPAIASCSPGSTGVPVTGIQVAIYKVNSCPAAGSFPLPVAYRTFTGNGTISAISGLTANSNYLLVATGIQNTKATFDIEFTGSALPSLLANLTGSVEENHNQLVWSADTSFGVNEMILERSADGLNFETLQEIVDKEQQESGEYSDVDPFPGSSFYRLKIEKGNGSIQYSQTITLNRIQQGFAVRLFPNPAGPNLNIEITTNDFGQYAVAMYNVFGQKVLMREFNVNSRRFVQSLNIMNLMKGVYYVAAFGKDGKKIVNSTIRIR